MKTFCAFLVKRRRCTRTFRANCRKNSSVPVGDENAPLQALILILFTILSEELKLILKVVNGKISKEKVKFMATDKVYEADEVGTLKLNKAEI